MTTGSVWYSTVVARFCSLSITLRSRWTSTFCAPLLHRHGKALMANIRSNARWRDVAMSQVGDYLRHTVRLNCTTTITAAAQPQPLAMFFPAARTGRPVGWGSPNHPRNRKCSRDGIRNQESGGGPSGSRRPVRVWLTVNGCLE